MKTSIHQHLPLAYSRRLIIFTLNIVRGPAVSHCAVSAEDKLQRHGSAVLGGVTVEMFIPLTASITNGDPESILETSKCTIK